MYFPDIFNKSDALLSYMMYYAAQLHPSFRKVKGKISPDQWMEKLKMRNLSWPMNGPETFKALNWLMSQYRKTVVAEFFFKTNSPVLEMVLFLEIKSIAVAKICWYFRNIFSTRACTYKLIFATRSTNYTWTERDRFWRLFHLWRSFHESPMTGIRHANQEV